MSDASDSTLNSDTNDSNSNSDSNNNSSNDLAAQLESLKNELETWKTEARKHERRSKEAVKELNTLKTSQLSDSDKAIQDAVNKAKGDWTKEFGSRLAQSEFKVAAKGRMDDKQLDNLLSALNMSQFVNDDGEPDAKGIADFLDGIVPKSDNKKTGTLDLGQGPRGSGNGNAISLNDDELARQVRRAVGIDN